MITLKQQLERVKGKLLIANIPDTEVPYSELKCLESGIITDCDLLELSSYENMSDMEQSMWNEVYEYGYLSEFNDYKSSRDKTGHRHKFYKTVEVPYLTSDMVFLMETEVEDLLNEGTLKMDDLDSVTIVTQKQYSYLVSNLTKLKG